MKAPWKSALAACTLVVTMSNPGETADGRLVGRLLERISAIPYVDTHCHVPAPAPEKTGSEPFDVVALLGKSTYVAEFLYSENWEDLKKRLAESSHHPYYRPILEAFRDLYGLPRGEELNDSNYRAVSAAMDAARRKPGWFEEVLRKRANLSHVVWIEGDRTGAARMPFPWFHAVWNIDSDFVFISAPDKKGNWPLDRVRKEFGTRIKSLSDMEKLIDREVDSFFARGGVALKSTAAYFRPLDFDPDPSRAAAARAFAKVLSRKKPGDTDRKALEDHLMGRVLGAVARNKKPIQFHTGHQQSWGMLEWCNPVLLNKLFYSGRFFDAKFVLLHGGYPYTGEAILMARYFGNVHMDMAWMVLFSPAAAKRTLAEAIDLVPGDRLLIGTDTANLEEMYGTIKFTRRVLAEVLAEKVEGGFLTEEAALAAARRVLNGNGMSLYEIKD